MAKTFSEIKITGMDEKKSKSVAPDSNLFNIVLQLSDFAPSEWAINFGVLWMEKQENSTTMRHALAHGNCLDIECTLEEFEHEILPMLKRIVADTNQMYSENKKENESAQEHAQELATSQQLKDIKQRIKFD